MRRKGPGKVRIRLAELLDKLFPDYFFDSIEIKQASRSDQIRWDVWGHARITGHNGEGYHRMRAYSFNTMTECVRRGIDRVEERQGCEDPYDVEVTAK